MLYRPTLSSAPPDGSRRTLAFVCLQLFSGIQLSAQVLASEFSKVSQTVDGTVISVEYYRPSKRGREIFGNIVAWDIPWTPGANWATTLEVSKDVLFNRQPLPKGKYSIWVVPRKSRDWEVSLSRLHRTYHLWPAPPESEQLRVIVKPQRGRDVDVLSWSFPTIMRDAATLRLEWTDIALSFHLSVIPSRVVDLTADEKLAVLGSWDMSFDLKTLEITKARVEIVDSAGALRVRGYPTESSVDSEFVLSGIGGSSFHPVYHRGGLPVGKDPEVTWFFNIQEGKPVTVELRDGENKRFALGQRVKTIATPQNPY